MTAPLTVGALLRRWRLRRRMSQLELSVRSGVSTRHISYMENGRSVPSRETLLHLLAVLDVAPREQNDALVSAGLAPAFAERPLNSPDLAAALAAVRAILAAHEPFPAVAMDHRWNLLWGNRSASVLMDGCRDPALLEPPVNMMRLGLSPDGVGHRVANLAEVRRALLARLERQVERSDDPELQELLTELAAHSPSATFIDEAPVDIAADIALPLVIDWQGEPLRLLAAITTFGTARDLTLQEIVVETYLPADEYTAGRLHAIDALDRPADADPSEPVIEWPGPR